MSDKSKKVQDVSKEPDPSVAKDYIEPSVAFLLDTFGPLRRRNRNFLRHGTEQETIRFVNHMIVQMKNRRQA